MTLDAYLTRNRITAAEFARVLGVHPATVGRYRKGSRVPRPSVALKIRRATYGEVTADDFLDHDPKPRLRGRGAPPDPGPERQAQAA